MKIFPHDIAKNPSHHSYTPIKQVVKYTFIYSFKFIGINNRRNVDYF